MQIKMYCENHAETKNLNKLNTALHYRLYRKIIVILSIAITSATSCEQLGISSPNFAH